MENLWEDVEKKCLTHASTMLNEETAPTVATVEAVKGLVETAISIQRKRNEYESPIGPGKTIHMKEI